MNIKRIFKTALAATGKTQAELAAALDITPSALSKLMERGRCTTTQITLAAEFFDMSPARLITIAEVGNG